MSRNTDKKKWKPAYSESSRKKNKLKPLPHPGEKCNCSRCDELRRLNAFVRDTLWNVPDYPPKFYEETGYPEEEVCTYRLVGVSQTVPEITEMF